MREDTLSPGCEKCPEGDEAPLLDDSIVARGPPSPATDDHPSISKPIEVCIKAHGEFGIIARFVLPNSAKVSAAFDMLASHGLRRRKIVLATKVNERAPESMGGYCLASEALDPRDMLQESWLVGDCITSGEPVHLLYLGSFEEDFLPLRDRQQEWKEEALEQVAEQPGEIVRTAMKVRYFRVSAPGVSVRDAPSLEARKLGALEQGDAVKGIAYKVGFEPWLRLASAAKPSWVLIHGASLGLGQLLELCEPGFRPAAPGRAAAGRAAPDRKRSQE